MKTTVTITQSHLDNQVPGDCYRCAVALALCDVIHLNTDAYVLDDRWRLEDAAGLRLLTRPLPPEVREFIYLADRGPEMIQLNPPNLPLTFVTDIPRKYRAKN